MHSLASVGFDRPTMSGHECADEAVLLELEGVSSGYEGRAVTLAVNLRLRLGSFTGLLGVNGSGKTTLLKTIAGILQPVTGKVVFRDINGHAPVLGYVPQREAFDPIFLFSASEVVAMGAQRGFKSGRLSRVKESTLTEQCLSRCGVADLAGQRFSELSGGQKQRMLIARALVAQPDFLLLDEPTAGIDAAASAGIGDLLRELNVQGMTILMVNHELDVVRKLAGEIIWLRRTSVVQGPAADLLSKERAAELFELNLG